MYSLLQEANAPTLLAFAHIRKLESQNQIAEGLIAIQSKFLEELTVSNEGLLNIHCQLEQNKKMLQELKCTRESDPQSSFSHDNLKSFSPSSLKVHKIPSPPIPTLSPNIQIQIPNLEWVIQYLSEITSQGIKESLLSKANGEQQQQQQRVILQKYKRRLSELNSKHVSMMEQFRKSQKSPPRYM